MSGIYKQGYISANQGSNKVEGIGTRWLNYVKPGDTLVREGESHIIAEVNDNQEITLDGVYLASSVIMGKYEIQKAARIKSLAELKAEAAAIVDSLAGKIRLKYITSTPGQDATYLAKLEDAKAYVAAGYPEDSTSYPWIHAEAAAVGVSAQVAADFIIYTAGQWAYVGSQIEGARQAAKRGVNSASDQAGVEQAVASFKTATASL